MKKLITICAAVLCLVFISNSYSQEIDLKFQNQDNQSGLDLTKRKDQKYWEIAPMGGIIFPVGIFSENFDISGRAGLDLGYKINKEVGIYGNITYNFLSSKIQEGPTASYLSYTIGPRYYFYTPKLKSMIFLEAGVGGFTFTQDEYSTTIQGVVTSFPEEGETRFGINAGIGGDVYVSDVVSIILKAKYNIILSGGDNARSFLSADVGLGFRL